MGHKPDFLQFLDSEQCFELQEDPIISWGVLKSCQENSARVEYQGERGGRMSKSPEAVETNPKIPTHDWKFTEKPSM